ncbi:MAG: NHL repeat-containing protein, partial [Dehalococcoidia bacterium]
FSLRIAVDSAHTWPWPWYLRDYSRENSVTYSDMSEGPPEGEYDVLLVDSGNAGAVNDWIADTGSTRYASPRQYIQLWWPNEAYKLAIPTGPFRTKPVSDSDFAVPYWPEWGTWKHIASGYFQDGWLRTSYDYWRDREPPGGNIQNEAFAYFPANFNPETGKLGATTVEPPGPTVDDEGRPAFGGFGNLPGQFIAPVDVAADAAGNLYVIDSSTRKLQKFDSAGNYLAGVDIRNIEENPDESAEPWGVTVGNGLVVVADTFGWKVRVFTTDLVKLTEFGQAPAADPPGEFDLFGPRDAIVTEAGEIWITDTGHDRIMVYTADGAFVRKVGDSGAGPGQVDEPVGLALGPDGNVYVADMYNARVQVFDTGGAFVREFAVDGWGGLDSLDKPYLTVLRDGSVAVSLPAAGMVRLYDAEGAELGVISSLSRPYGIVEGADGRLWVSEGASGRLRLFEIPR